MGTRRRQACSQGLARSSREKIGRATLGNGTTTTVRKLLERKGPAQIREARAVNRRGKALEATLRALSVRSSVRYRSSPVASLSSQRTPGTRTALAVGHRLDQRARKAVPAGHSTLPT